MSCAWEWIDLPALPCRYGHGELRPTLGGNHGGFRVDMVAMLPDAWMAARFAVGGRDRDTDALFADPAFQARLAELEAANQAKLPARDAVEVALVVDGASIAIDTPARVFGGATCKSGTAQYHGVWHLPWPADPLGDLAIAIRIDGIEHVIALPYGLCRDESLPLPPPSPRPAGPAHALAWASVQFVTRLHLGPYHATLRAASASPGVLAVEVYREADRWSAPPVTLTVDGRPARRIGELEQPDFLRRVARFDVAAPGPRRFARVVTQVADHTFETIVPSSLLEVAAHTRAS